MRGILRAWRDPRAEMRALIASGLTEGRVLSFVFIACAIGFLASLPEAFRKANALGVEPVGTVTAHIFGYLFIAPLLLYGLAALIHLLARPFGAKGGFFGARAALFWSLVVASPIPLALVLLTFVSGGTLLPWLRFLGYAGLVAWLWIFAASLAEAEGFSATGRVVAVLALGLAGIALSLTTVAHGASFAG